jgi:hypothetical protein
MKLQDEEGHHDCEETVAQRFDPIFADFKCCRFGAHGIADWLLGPTRCDRTASRTGVRLFEYSAELNVQLFDCGGVRRINYLVGVVVHLLAAVRAGHLLVCHGRPLHYGALGLLITHNNSAKFSKVFVVRDLCR